MMGPEACDPGDWDDLVDDQSNNREDDSDNDQPDWLQDDDIQLWLDRHQEWQTRNKDEPVKFELSMTRRRWKHLADILEDTENFDWLQQRILEEIDYPTLETVRTDLPIDSNA